MPQVVATGILMGLTLSIAAGPVMFALIQTSIREGFWRTFAMELGILSSDAGFILLAFYSLGSYLDDHPEIITWISLGGGVLLIGMGLFKWFSKDREAKKVKEMMRGRKSNYLKLFGEGFFYNTVNPSVLLFWMGTFAFVSAEFNNNPEQIKWHFILTLVTLLGLDILKIYFAGKLKFFFTPRRMVVMNQILGLIFLGFGIFLLARTAWLEFV